VQAFAWLSLLVLLAAAAGASTLYATNTHLPHKTAATIAAILPWALALLGFFLLLAMLRHARLRRAQSRRATSAAAVAQQADTIPGTVPAAAAAGELGADDTWPDGEYPDGEVQSPGQTAEPAATGYPGDVLVAGRPPADDADAEAPATDEPAGHETAADEAVAGAGVAGAAAAGAAAGKLAADHRSAATVPGQALPAQPEPASTEPASAEPASTGPADTEPAGTAPAAAAAAAGAAAGIPLRRPGGSRADEPEPETAESSLDSEPGQDDPVSDEGHPASHPGAVWVPRAREEPSAEVIRDEPEPSPTETAEAAPGSQEASTEAPDAASQGTAPETASEGTTPEAASAGTAQEAASPGTAPAGPGGGATEPGQAGENWFSPANGSAGSAGAAPAQPGGAPGPAEQPGQPPVTSFWDSVFGPRTPEGTDQPAGSSPAGTGQEQAEGHPATQPSETATADEEPQFDRFRSSPTPPDDE
jgi:hypothetical protein